MTDQPAPSTQPASTGPDPLVGQTLDGRFKIMSVIARGGMGKVYKGEQTQLGRVCAIKVLNPTAENDPDFHKRFFLEASICSKLTHPNTVTIFDYGQVDEIYYIAMEYLEAALHRAIKDEGPFPEERAAHVARQICRALREAHGMGVVHRDLKPANVYLIEHSDEQDFVKVLDFGLVKNVDGEGEEFTQAGIFMGSPENMSPEQIRGEKADGRTDIYSLGVVIYEMVTGKVPFEKATSVNTLMAHVHDTPPPLRDINPSCSVSAEFESVIFRCLAKDPNDRFASMDEVLAALKRGPDGAFTGTQMNPAALSGPTPLYQSGGGSTAALTAPVLDVGPPPKKSKAWVGIVAVAALGAAGFFATRSSDGDKAAAAPPSAPPPVTAAAPPVVSTPAPAKVEPPKPAVQKAKIRVESDPSGATVRKKDKDGDVLCKETPCDVELTGDDAKPGTEHKLHFSKKGVNAETRTFKVGDEKISARLAPVGGGGGAVPAVAKPPPGGAGFKEVPY